MKVRLTLKSRNKKTGPIPVSTTERKSCPSTCPLKGNGCYADSGPLALVWNETPQVGKAWGQFCKSISSLKDGQLWRHNQAGDLPHKSDIIDRAKLAKLVIANNGKRGFTYTHHDMASGANQESVAFANRNGFTVNLSANNLDHADKLARLNIGPVVVVLPIDQLTNTRTPQGEFVTVCPVVTGKAESCATCKLCAIPNRQTIIGFPAHGTGKRKAQSVAIG
jgi:hypothetical protein